MRQAPEGPRDGLVGRGRGPVVRLDLPEQGSLSMPLAGLGSRASAAVFDAICLTAVPLVVALTSLVAFPELSEEAAFLGALAAVGMLLLWLGPLVLELWGGGETPGKRRAHIRVVSSDGHPASKQQLMIRNVLRMADFLPVGYLFGAAVLFVSSRGQRLGDVAAGTLVVRVGERALAEAMGGHDAFQPPPELSGIPLALLRATRALTDPGRALDERVAEPRRAEILAGVRAARADLSKLTDAELWQLLRRGVS